MSDQNAVERAEPQQTQNQQAEPLQIQDPAIESDHVESELVFFKDFEDFEEIIPEKEMSEQELRGSAVVFDPRRIKRDSKSLRYSEECTLRNQIYCAARDLYLSQEAAQGISDLHSHFAVLVGGEFDVYRADLFIFEHDGFVWGVPAATRVGALRMLLKRLTDHLESWQCNLALAGH